jgi:hypothetical protein
MANKKHLRILEEGVEAWNEWRKEDPDIKHSLSKSNLTHMDLGRANQLRRRNRF